jgi:hypothetical protein
VGWSLFGISGEVQYYFRLWCKDSAKPYTAVQSVQGWVCLLQNVNVGLKVNSVATLLIQRAEICRLVVTKSDKNPRMILFKITTKICTCPISFVTANLTIPESVHSYFAKNLQNSVASLLAQ